MNLAIPGFSTAGVFIVSGNVLLRQGLRDLVVAHGLQVTGEGASGREALRLIPELKPRVVVIEDILQDGSGVEVSRSVREKSPSARSLLLTGWEEARAERATVLAQAAGFLAKQAGDAAGLVSALRAAGAGHMLMAAEARTRAAAGLAMTAAAPWLNAPSGERLVLTLMAQDLTNNQIAVTAKLPVEQVGDLVSSVLLKLGIGTGPRSVGGLPA